MKRVYEKAAPEDGFRILLDRLWPRGVSKEKAHLDLWLKEAAPSTELRKWFAHDPEKWPEFKKRYREELRAAPEPLKELHRLEKQHRTITLLFGARDEEHNEAAVVRDMLAATRDTTT